MNTSIRSTIQLLRFHFSLFLTPVYFFALSEIHEINPANAITIFIILHLLVYPASNGYNSYMDRDTSPIGGIKKPLQPTKQLFLVTICMDIIAISLSLFISYFFTAGILLYILASRTYSYRKIRLKKYPVTGYLTVIIFQGAEIFFLVFTGANSNHHAAVPVIAMIAATLLIGGFYPLTQIYQHEEDLKDGVITISYKLGYKGTFIFTGIIYALAFGALVLHFISNHHAIRFLILLIFLLPVLVYFFVWFGKVVKDKNAANFKNTMRMNMLASVCTNLGFITILILNQLE